jgi:uncharacterized membrane protein YqjE
MSMSAPASSPSARPASSLPRLAVEALVHRSELAGLEFEEARTHAAVTAFIIGASVALTLLFGTATTFAIAAAVWDRPNRGLILTLVAVAYLLGAAGLAWWAARRLKDWRPFTSTIDQLRKDYSCLHSHLSEKSR